MNALRKVWSFLVRYWKFFVGFFLALGGFVVFSRISNREQEDQKLAEKIDESGKKFLDAVVSANIARDRQLIELSRKHKDKIRTLSSEQQSELASLAEKPIEEVVAWFDKL